MKLLSQAPQQQSNNNCEKSSTQGQEMGQLTTLSFAKGNSSYTSPMRSNIQHTQMDVSTNSYDFYNVCDFIKILAIEKCIGKPLENQLKIGTVDNNNNKRTFLINSTAINSDTKLLEELNKNLFFIPNNFIRPLNSYLTVNARYLNANQKFNYKHTNLGWYNLEDTNERLFLLKKAIGSNIDTTYFDTSFNFQKGDERVFDTLIKNIILTTTPLQTGLVIGLTSIVCSLLKEHTGITAMFIDIAGQSSSGKSTIQEFICSLYGDPKINNNGLFRTFNGTTNSFISASEGMHGVPIVIDDASLKEGNINWEEFVYQMAEGESKSRCKSDGSLQIKNDSWDGLIVISSEHSILDNTTTKQGLKARILIAEDIKWTTSAEESNFIKKTVKTNFGFIAPKFVQSLINSDRCEISKLENMFDEGLKLILSKIFKPDKLSSRICGHIALLGLTCDLITELLGYKLDKEKILQPFIDNENNGITKRDIAEEALELVKQFIAKNHSNFYDFSSNYTPKNCYGCIDKNSNHTKVEILTNELMSFFQRNNIVEHKNIFNKWKQQNILITDKDHYSKKETKLVGSPRVYVLKFSDCWVPEDSITTTPASNFVFDDTEAINKIFEEAN